MAVDTSTLVQLVTSQPGATVLIGLVVATVLVTKFAQRRRDPLNKVPTPPGWWPVLGHLPLFLDWTKPLSECVLAVTTELARKYRKEGLFKLDLGPKRTVFLVSPEAIEAVMTSTTNIHKGVEYDLMRSWLGYGLLVANGDKWRRDRKTLTPAFHFKILDDLSPLVNKYACDFCDKVALEPRQSDVLFTISHLTMGVICETSFGVNINNAASEEVDGYEYERAFRDYAVIFPSRVMNPFLYNDTIYGLTIHGRRAARAVLLMHKFSRGIIKIRKQELQRLKEDKGEQFDDEDVFVEKRKSLLDILLSMENLSEQDIREQLDTFVFAGHDTTAVAITMCLYNLGTRQDVQDEAYRELQDVFDGCAPDEITLEQLKRLEFLECVIKETLRLTPSVPIIARLIKEDIKIKDYLIPEGTDVWILLGAMQIGQENFPDPDKFEPNRFSRNKPSSGSHSHFGYVPFSAGPRNCIGQRFAMTEMKTVLAYVLSKFELRTVSSTPTLLFEGTMKFKEPMVIDFIKR